jgi:D-proline reductase (dithiol) PrdB
MKETDFSFLPNNKKLIYEQIARSYRERGPQTSFAWTPFTRRLIDSKIALISVVGGYLKGQKPFTKRGKDSDYEFREININFDKKHLKFLQLDWETSEAKKDFNVVLPIERLVLLQKEGAIGKIDNTVYSFSGHNENRGLIKKSINKLTKRLKKSEVDGALIVPTSTKTGETAGIIASQIEKESISTVMLSLFYEQALFLSPPRCSFINFPFGRTFGPANQITLHTAILRDTLRLFEKVKSPNSLITFNYIWPNGTIPDW